MADILTLAGTGAFARDTRSLVRDAAQAPSGDDRSLILPFESWFERLASGHVAPAVWLAPDADVTVLRPVLERLQLVALDFPKFVDGRAFSIAVVLRTQYGYRGELRAVGEVTIDQLFSLRRVGFDSVEARADWDSPNKRTAVAGALRSYTNAYQASADDPLPLFRRRLAASERA